MIHKEGQCIIKVDEKIVPIVQYILDNYPYSVVPFSCCEGDKDTMAQISVIVRDMQEFNKLLTDIFLGTDDVEIRYKIWNNVGTYLLEWPYQHTDWLLNMIKPLKKVK
jgi:hypothetical protein